VDADTLQSEITRLAADAKSRREEANRLRTSATGNRTTGKGDEADAEENQAAMLDQEADGLEQQVSSAQAQYADTIGRIKSIERRQSELKDRYEREMADLQREKDRLSGMPGSISTSIF
jgi:chromosome segregation ATPase